MNPPGHDLHPARVLLKIPKSPPPTLLYPEKWYVFIRSCMLTQSCTFTGPSVLSGLCVLARLCILTVRLLGPITAAADGC